MVVFAKSIGLDLQIGGRLPDGMKEYEELEKYTQYVYSMLLNMKNDGIKVERNINLVGRRTGVKYQIDIYYEFKRAGIKHRVIIECKALKRPVEMEEVLKLVAKINDIGDVTGIIVSKNGYQKGAIQYAEQNDIKLLELKDLPAMNILMANKIATVGLPEESYIGEPFWVLMEQKDGKVTGSYHGQLDKTGKPLITLFYSKRIAQKFLEELSNRGTYVVRGLPQFCLRTVLFFAAFGNWDFVIMYGKDMEEMKWVGKCFSFKEIKEDYYLGQENFG